VLLVLAATLCGGELRGASVEASPPETNSPEATLEYQVKAAFLYNFTRYVKWPKEAFDDERSPIVVAVLGSDPFGITLDKVFAGKTASGRRIQVTRFASTAKLEKCHLLFVPRDETESLPLLAKHLAGAPVLIVGESKDFAVEGGEINFYIDKKKVHFEINKMAAERAKLEISSQLLKLARIVEDKR